jgi:hypothetical protein
MFDDDASISLSHTIQGIGGQETRGYSQYLLMTSVKTLIFLDADSCVDSLIKQRKPQRLELTAKPMAPSAA